VWTHFCVRFKVEQLHIKSSKQLINDICADRLSECAPFLPKLNLELSEIPSSDVKLSWYGKMRRCRPTLTKALYKFKSLTSLCNIMKYKRNRNQFLFRFCHNRVTSFSRSYKKNRERDVRVTRKWQFIPVYDVMHGLSTCHLKTTAPDLEPCTYVMSCHEVTVTQECRRVKRL
jgi:hypothetical protein